MSLCGILFGNTKNVYIPLLDIRNKEGTLLCWMHYTSLFLLKNLDLPAAFRLSAPDIVYKF